MALSKGLTRPRGFRNRLVLLVSLVVGVSLLSLAGLDPAGAAATKPDHLFIKSIAISIDGVDYTLPPAAGNFVAPVSPNAVKYTVEVQDANGQPAPVSGSVTISLTESGAGNFTTAPQGTIRSRGTQVTISAAYALADPTARQEYNVQVTASATDLGPDTAKGNFVRDFNPFASLGSNSLISAGGGCAKKKGCSAATARVFSASQTTDPESLCTATATQPTCVIIELNNGANGFAVLTLSDCDLFGGSGGLSSADCSSLLVSFLADINGLYTNAAPLTMILKCDSTTCGGGGISSYTIFVDSNNGVPVDADASQPCAANSHVIPDGLNFCTDYNASHRDNAQDLVMYLLVARDFTGKIH